MTPTQVILSALQALIAGDTATLADTVALKVHLIAGPFTPSRDTDLATLTPATFTGSTAKAAGIGTAQKFNDPITNELTVQLLEPAGGWHWQASANTGLPETIYGYVVTNNAGNVTYGSRLLDNPVTITDTGDGVDIGNVRFSFVPPVLH